MRIEQLTFTRFLAAAAIVIFHYGRDVFPFNKTVISSIFGNTPVAVSYFFMLSGFVLVLSLRNVEKVSFSPFLKRRLLRIYPAYLVSSILMLFYILLSNNTLNLSHFFLNLSLLQSWFPGNALVFNPPAWSISVEFFLYLSLPFLMNHFYKRVPMKYLVLSAVIFIVLINWLTNFILGSSFYTGFPSASHDWIQYFPPLHLGSFVLGNLAAFYFLKKGVLGNYDRYVLAIVLCFVLFASFEIPFNLHNGAMSILFIPFIVFCSQNTGRITQLFSLKPLILLGEISYGLYILQEPIFYWVKGGLSQLNINSKEIQFYASFGVLLISATLTYKLIETPIRRYFKGHQTT